jgi:uroporphyrinogen-III synthase
VSSPSFEGLSVLTLESRRSAEQATLISRFDGRPLVAPSVRELPLEAQTEAVRFIDGLVEHRFDCVIFLTGVGARVLLEVATGRGQRDQFVAALRRTRVVARGPKPVAVMRELSVPVWVVAPEPNTWHELLAEIDRRAGEFSLKGARVAVQEYGVPNPELLQALESRGAEVTAVPAYRWALPEELEPLRNALDALEQGRVDVLVLTSGVQFAHLWRVAEDMGREEGVRRGLAQAVIASIGPTCSSEVRRYGLEPDLEASHPKMGILITEAAARAREILQMKRAAGGV